MESIIKKFLKITIACTLVSVPLGIAMHHFGIPAETRTTVFISVGFFIGWFVR